MKPRTNKTITTPPSGGFKTPKLASTPKGKTIMDDYIDDDEQFYQFIKETVDNRPLEPTKVPPILPVTNPARVEDETVFVPDARPLGLPPNKSVLPKENTGRNRK